jgi:hypothetical protein
MDLLGSSDLRLNTDMMHGSVNHAGDVGCSRSDLAVPLASSASTKIKNITRNETTNFTAFCERRVDSVVVSRVA